MIKNMVFTPLIFLLFACSPTLILSENESETHKSTVSIYSRPVYGADIGYLFYALSAPYKSGVYDFIDNLSVPSSSTAMYQVIQDKGIFLYEGGDDAIFYYNDLKTITLNYVTGETWVTLSDRSTRDHTWLKRKHTYKSFEDWSIFDPDVVELNKLLEKTDRQTLHQGDSIKVYFLLISYKNGKPYHLTSFARYKTFDLE